MVELDKFPEDIYQTLIALPYRVGLYISLSDQTGGNESSEREMEALENVVTFYVEDTLKSEFAQTVMLTTLQNKIKWSDWQSNIDKVPAECSDMIGYLADRLDARNLEAFKQNLLEIAIAVAMAYREIDAKTGFLLRLKSWMLLLLSKNPANNNSPYLNISPAEKNAINKLADLFGLNYKIA